MNQQTIKPFLPSKELSESPWPIKYIFLGIGLLILFQIIPYVSKYSNLFLEPWRYVSVSLISTIIYDVALIIFTFLILRKRNLWSTPSKVSPFMLLKEIIRAFFIFILIALAIGPIIAIVQLLFKKKSIYSTLEFLEFMPSHPLILISFLILSFTVAPLAEELFFRGFLYNAMKSRLSIVIAAIIQAFIFSLTHPYTISERLFIFLFGIALVIVYEKRKSLLAPMLVHCITNALVAVPVFIFLVQNYHVPAADWEEAKVRPEWVTAAPSVEIERQEDGLKQWQYAIDTWGSKGSKKWKKEVNAFHAVCFWFPDDRKACAKAKLGIITIYTSYLKDYRRAIVEADRLLAEYPEEKEQYALALSKKGLAYLMLKDFKNSRMSFNRVISEFKNYEKAYEQAQRNIKLLDRLESK